MRALHTVPALLTTWFLATAPVEAQRPISYGLVGGLGPSLLFSKPAELDLGRDNQQNIDQYLSIKQGGDFGAQVNAYVRIQPWHRYFLQPEFGYQEMRSGEIKYVRKSGGSLLSFGPATRTRLYQQAITVNLLGGGYVGQTQMLYWLAGPAYAGRVSSHVVWPYSNPSKVEQALDESAVRSQFFAHAGLGIRRSRFGFELRYIHGLTPLIRTLAYDGRSYPLRLNSSLLVVSTEIHFPRHQE